MVKISTFVVLGHLLASSVLALSVPEEYRRDESDVMDLEVREPFFGLIVSAIKGIATLAKMKKKKKHKRDLEDLDVLERDFDEFMLD